MTELMARRGREGGREGEGGRKREREREREKERERGRVCWWCDRVSW